MRALRGRWRAQRNYRVPMQPDSATSSCLGAPGDAYSSVGGLAHGGNIRSIRLGLGATGTGIERPGPSCMCASGAVQTAPPEFGVGVGPAPAAERCHWQWTLTEAAVTASASGNVLVRRGWA